MIDDIEFSELVLTWDTREQSNAESRTRVKRIIDWFKQRGGTMIEQMALPLCDYHIGGGYDESTKTFLPGTFREKDINLAIEYKTMVDYGNSGSDLDWKLIESYKYYDQVALFVEENNISLSYVDGKTYIKNPVIPNGKADVTVYEHYKNEIDRFSQIADIHVRTFPYETFIDVNLDSLMILLSEEPKVRLYCRGEGKDDTKAAFITALLAIPKIGVKTALKFADVYSNLAQFLNHACYEGEYEKIAGHLIGKKIRAFVTDNSRQNECLLNYRAMFNISTENSSQHSSHPGKSVSIPTTNLLSTTPGDSGGTTKDTATSISHSSTNSTRPTIVVPSVLGDMSGKVSTESPLPGDLSHEVHEPSRNVQSQRFGTSDTSESVEQLNLAKNRTSAQPSSSSRSIINTPDTSSHPSSEPFSKTSPNSNPSGDDDWQGVIVIPTSPAEHLTKPKLPKKDQTILSLNDAIVDFCYDSPKSDTEILSTFQYKGFQLPEIHKALTDLAKTKLHRYKDKKNTMGIWMYGYNGIRGDVEFDVGV